LALSIYIGRVIFTGNWLIYRFLVWNLFLAWIPYFFSVFAAATYRLFPRSWWMLLLPGTLWLVFIPNAPYIVTDFLHLRSRPPIPIWYDIGLLASFAWTGLFLAIASLRTMHELVKAHAGWFAGWLFTTLALALGGLGLYLGRFSRWNSWDLVIQPEQILVDIGYRFINPISNLRFFGFTFMFTTFLLVCYLMFVSVHRLGGSQER
jgi:uncharacterized membrane protein